MLKKKHMKFLKWKFQWMNELVDEIQLNKDSVDWNIELRKLKHNVSHRDGKYKGQEMWRIK